jgi:hypothetical protein
MSKGRNGVSYCVITAHFLDSKFTSLFEELLLIAPFDNESHSGENIKEFVSQEVLKVVKPGKTVDSANLPKYIIAITGDCASNNASFENLTNIYRIRCIGHRLNTLGKTLDFKQEIVTFDKTGELPVNASLFSIYSVCVYKINRFLHHEHGKSSLRNQLQQYQKNLRGTNGVRGPIRGAPTRWTYGPKYLKRSMELLLDLEGLYDQEIKHFEGMDELKLLLIEFRAKYSVFEYFMELFYRIKFWIEVTETNKDPTSSMVLYAIGDLRALIDNLINSLNDEKVNQLVEGNEDALDVPILILEKFKEDFKKIFINDMRKKTVQSGENLKFFEDSLLLKVAKLLDIRFVFLEIDGSDLNVTFTWNDINLIHQYYIKRYGEDNYGQDVFIEHVEEATDDLVKGKPAFHRLTGEERFNEELRRYVELVSIEIRKIKSEYPEKGALIQKILNLNPLKFWNEHHGKFNFLSKIAGQVLAVPAQSAPSERVFSRMTAVISSGRTRLTSTNGAKLIQLCQRYLSRILPRSQHHDPVKRKRTSLITRNGNIEYPPFGAFTRELKYIDYDIIEQDKDSDYEPSGSEPEKDDDDFVIPTSSKDDNDDPASSDDEGEVEVQEDVTTSKKRSGTVNYAELNSGKRSTPR